MRTHRQIKAWVTAISIAFLVASCASRPRVDTGGDVERAKAFMASYAKELRGGDRDAMAARYHPDGAFIVGDGKKTFETHDETVAYYRVQWQQPQAFEWQDLSFEPAGSGAVVVIGRFNWQKQGATQGTLYSYSSLLVPVAGQLKIRVEDESGAQ